jgi:hypothetical protein
MMAKRKTPRKQKASKRKPRETIPEERDGFDEYGSATASHLTHEIFFEIHNGNSNLENLVNAIHCIDQYRLQKPRPDKKPLVEILKSRGTTVAENKLLADLIDRAVLTWPVGARRRPAYMQSEEDHHLRNALVSVRRLRDDGLSVAEAITQVSKEYGIPYQKLEDAYHGRRRSMRKKK